MKGGPLGVLPGHLADHLQRAGASPRPDEGGRFWLCVSATPLSLFISIRIGHCSNSGWKDIVEPFVESFPWLFFGLTLTGWAAKGLRINSKFKDAYFKFLYSILFQTFQNEKASSEGDKKNCSKLLYTRHWNEAQQQQTFPLVKCCPLLGKELQKAPVTTPRWSYRRVSNDVCVLRESPAAFYPTSTRRQPLLWLVSHRTRPRPSTRTTTTWTTRPQPVSHISGS